MPALTPAAASTARWLREGAQQPVLALPSQRPHVLGSVVGLASLALGVLAQREGFPAQQLVSALALGGVGLGMLLHWGVQQVDGGWRVDFERRLIEPLGAGAGAAVQIAGGGWRIQGGGPGQIAIDLRHEDRGRVVRLVDRPARRFAEVKRLDALADLLARRLQVARSGLTLQSA